MKRKLMKDLLAWKNREERMPLILEGARQVGKTYLLLELGEKHFSNVIYVNLQNPSDEMLELFAGSFSPDRIILGLEIMYSQSIVAGKTLIIFDEIQEVPRALTSLKYFTEQARDYHVVASGSLLGLFLHQGTSFPVGKVECLRLEPFSFEEFLWGNGEEKLTAYVKDNYIERIFDEKLKDNFKYYMAVGGMPAAVNSWVKDRNILEVEAVHKRILANYVNDFSKYADTNTAIKIKQIWDNLANQFAKSNEKFKYSLLKKGARANEYELAMQWLIDSGIVRKVCRVERGDKIPLKAYRDIATFKLYFVDVGLFRTLAEIPARVIMNKQQIFNEFNGLLVEQYILQELSNRNLYYWSSGATSEVDFVTQFPEDILPIEVKSGENVRAQSLKVYRQMYQPKLSVRFSILGLEYNEGLLNVPLYKAFIFEEIIREYIETVDSI